MSSTATGGAACATAGGSRRRWLSTTAAATSLSLRPLCWEWSRSISKAGSAAIEWRAIRIPSPARSSPAARTPLQALVLAEALQGDVDRALQLLRGAVDDVGEHASLRRLVHVAGIAGVQDRNHRAGGLADDLGDQLESVVGARPEPDQCDVGMLPGRDLPDLLDVDLTGDHVMPQPDHHLRQQLQPIAPLARDQDTQMLGCGLGHGYTKALIAARSSWSPIALVRSSIALIASSGTRRRRQPRRLKRTDSASGTSGDPPYIGPSTRPPRIRDQEAGRPSEVDARARQLQRRYPSHLFPLGEHPITRPRDSTTKNRSAARTTTPPSKWAGATTNWSALRCLSATAGTLPRQLGLAHSQRRPETRPMRSRFQARRASLSASRLDRIHSRRARFESVDGGPGRTAVGAARTAPPRVGTATPGTSTMAPPVIEQIADHAGWAGRYCSNPHACGRTSRRTPWRRAPTGTPQRRILVAPRVHDPSTSVLELPGHRAVRQEARATLCARRFIELASSR